MEVPGMGGKREKGKGGGEGDGEGRKDPTEEQSSSSVVRKQLRKQPVSDTGISTTAKMT